MKKYIIPTSIALATIMSVSAQGAPTPTAQTGQAVQQGQMMMRQGRGEGQGQGRPSGQMMQAPTITTGDAAVDAQIKALQQEMETKIKAIRDEYQAKIKIIAGTKQMKVINGKAVMMGSSTNRDPRGEEGYEQSNARMMRGTSTPGMMDDNRRQNGENDGNEGNQGQSFLRGLFGKLFNR